MSISEGREALVARIRKTVEDTDDASFLIRTHQMKKDIYWIEKELLDEIDDDLIKSIDILHMNDGWESVASVILRVQLHTLEDL